MARKDKRKAKELLSAIVTAIRILEKKDELLKSDRYYIIDVLILCSKKIKEDIENES